ncbi:MAG: class I SAM-dependent methyltransferase [Alphaproteobacteria bacterium]|uniref:Putative methyltransferase n=1 Tax=viral metagenome TaxID=1070528 RepID=A0A6M3XC23_9ZZZZ|nr:class I SAM-dependent methyltransferase [Alphaproteobacteria bacterium]MBU1549452.1 class I SAM-dependent methyltransferase [Alphaproteobacteria bacterium]MBU2337011.1 class I SAM-dependent methyltransferase [Alphaproteobacteria bacterium]MBU2391450.1 class I SAM-dependent methyltransferase [Alphaproteobacteria bacterium]
MRDEADQIHSAVRDYYTAAIGRYGSTAKGVDWNDEPSHRLRQEQFLRLLTCNPLASVLDLGCGYGDFLQVLREAGHSGFYLGCDLSPAMIEAAQRTFGDGPDRRWCVGDDPGETCDFAVASGIFNVRRGADPSTWTRYVDTTIDKLARLGRRGFGFNMLSTCSDLERRRSDLHYVDPVVMLKACLDRYGRQVAILQDYGLWEFTVLVRHSSQTASPKPVAP